EGLLSPAPDGGPPRLAAAENFDVSVDGLTYTFQLRAGARWSNGEPVTADDFVASFRRVLTPATAAPKADLFFAVKNARAFATGALADFSAVGIRAPDARTVVVTLETPSPRFPLYVASGPWIPVNPRVVAQHGRNWTQPRHFVGNGPFTLAEWRPQQRIVVKKNPTYHGANATKLDEIQFLRFDSGDTEERAFRAGQVDITMAVPPSKLANYARERPPRLHRTLLAETRHLSFNTARAPLNDVRVRLALALSIDRQKIVDRVLLGGQQPAGRFLPPALRSARDTAPLATEQQLDPVEARRLLALAGFAGGRNFPKLELTGWTITPVLEAVQEMWRQELRIEVSIAVREANVHLAALRSGAYDIAFVTTLLDVTDAMALLGDFVSQAPNNLPHWQAGGYDELLARAAARPDLPSQAGDLLAAELLLLERAPVAPLYFNTRNWLMAPRVRGWQDDALWTRYYSGVWLSGK
ncbi:MAG: peptide ABC transporter substrate-binding protein, partial [Verrucomicrobia bacterium]|nr:peptide ABC transporter substrate-binding protein [Verrucomicrobiota bacterium]